MCVTICGRFRSDEGTVADYGNRIRVKYTAKWGVQIAGMIFQTGFRACCCEQENSNPLFAQFTRVFGQVAIEICAACFLFGKITGEKQHSATE